ncbi:hypothetical protein MJM99_29480, partial [Salmonella enterica subsp. enterica serovar Kentucky]|nr:hypothetical protein [Salmonella enterica subsp. enterica serovar Kentucky]
FYYSPARPEVKALFGCLPTLPELYPWRDRGPIESLCASWSLPGDVLNIFRCFGEAEVIAEPMIHPVVGVSGSSPAYVFMFIEAMA